MFVIRFEFLLKIKFTFIGDGEVVFTEYEASVEGMINSFIDRFPSYDEDLFNLWEKEIKSHNY